MSYFVTGTYGKMGITEAFYIFAVLSAASGIQVTIPQKVYEVARGDNVSLPCKYVSALGLSPVTASWSILGNDPNEPSVDMVTTYYFADKTLDVSPAFTNRASMNPQVTTGQVDLSLSNLMMSDNATFECHVQIPKDVSGNTNAKTRLLVLVAPSVPICGIQGSPTIGQDIRLTCQSSEGSPPPAYTWESYDTTNKPRSFPPKATTQGGVLSLFNITTDTSGYYICKSTNKIRSQSCNYTLAVTFPSMSIGSTAIIAGVGLAAVLLLGIIIYCCCCRRREKDTEGYEMGEPEQALNDSFAKANTVEYHDDERHTDCKDRLDVHGERNENGKDDEDHGDDNGDRRDNNDDRRSDYSGRRDNYDDRRSDYSGRRDNYDDRRSDYSGRRDNYDDRGNRYDDRRDDYDRRDRYDDRRDDFDRRDRYDDRRDDYDRRDRYDDRRDDYDRRGRNDDRRDRRGSSDDLSDRSGERSDRYNGRRNQYDEVSDNDRERPPSVPPNKPRKMD